MKNMTLNQWADATYKGACDHGFHSYGDTEDQFVEKALNNLHDEISELHEAFRNNKLRELCDKADKMKELGLIPLTNLEEELADIVLRVLDDAKHLGVDIGFAVEIKHKYNQSRPYRHGDKKS